MAYNLTNVTEANDFAGVFGGINQASGGLLSVLVLSLIYILVFIIFKDKYDTKAIFLANNIFITIIGALFWAAGYISLQILLIPIGLVSISIIVILMSN